MFKSTIVDNYIDILDEMNDKNMINDIIKTSISKRAIQYDSDDNENEEENKEENKEEKPKKRECISCHKKNIDGSKPKLITKCAKCYTKNEDTIPDLTMHMGNLNLLSAMVNKK